MITAKVQARLYLYCTSLDVVSPQATFQSTVIEDPRVPH